MKDFSFWIETACVCDQQMNNIIQSFQTDKSICVISEKTIVTIDFVQ